MSQENVGLVQALYRAVNRNDAEAILALMAPDIEIVPDLLLDQGLVRGHEGVRALRATLREAWGDSFRISPEEFIEHEDRVVVILRVEGTAKASGLNVDLPGAHLATLRDGKVARLETFPSRSQALEAVGLRE